MVYVDGEGTVHKSIDGEVRVSIHGLGFDGAAFSCRSCLVCGVMYSVCSSVFVYTNVCLCYVVCGVGVGVGVVAAVE